MSLKSKTIHESYHKKTTAQSKIINSSNFTYKLMLTEIKKYLKPNMKILDIGCGAGTLDFYLSSQGYYVTGVDISEISIRKCKETAKNLGIKHIKFLHSDFPNISIKEKFDFIIFTEVIEHLENDEAALKRIYKLLNKNGILFLSTPSSNAPLYKLGLTKKFDKDVGHLRRYDEKTIKMLVSKTGLKILEVKKNEGILRNFLFINPFAGKFIRLFRFFISDIVTFLDNLTIPLCGESDFIVVARRM